MLSRRNFLTITVIMIVLFFMFQFSNVIKDRWNDYGTNEYEETKEERTSQEVSYQEEGQEDYVVYIGDTEKTTLGRVVAEWAGYTKRGLTDYASLEEYTVDTEHLPEAVLLDAGYLDFHRDTQILTEMAEQGIHLIFCNLPETSVIRENKELQTLLGINKIQKDSVELKGVHLFEGFLLGGAVQYYASTEKEEKKQDLDLNIPWYITRSGTKTYMVGMMENEEIKNEYLPSIIWRNSFGEARIFVVNGDYMADSTGLGILTAFMSELHDYEIYPVVNAQNMVIANYPGLASENDEKMKELYSRTQKEVFRDIAWPGVAAISERSKMKLTCMIAPQFDYLDGRTPNEEDLTYYLKLMKEKSAEAGLSASQVSHLPLEEKLKEDMEFLDQCIENYAFQSFYVGDEEDYLPLLGTGLLKDVRTVVKDYDEESPILSYANEKVTLQSATIDGFGHTYSEDIRVKSLETALGYSNIVADMKRLAYPERKEDSWEKMYDELASNTDTYWRNFTTFEQTVLSESDERIRNFLALDFSDQRREDTIYLKVENLNKQAWFILRTHEESIREIEGADYEEIEEGAYLIQVKKEEVAITLKSDIELYYYDDEK